MLRGILSQCCFPQLSYLSARVRELVRIDFLSALPTELAFKILCCLDTISLCKATQVSRRWRQLADDDVVWHRMCEQHIDRKCTKCGWGLPLLERKRLRASKREIQLRASGQGMNEWSPHPTPAPESALPEHVAYQEAKTKEEPTSAFLPASQPVQVEDAGPRFRPWKDVYRDRFKVGSNWKHGRCATKIFKGHTNGVMSLQFDDKHLITGSYDTTVKVWDIETASLLRTMRGHTSGIRSLQFDCTKLITGSLDTSIKVWNWRNGECLRTISGHTGGIISVHFESTYLVSGSTDTTIRLWNFEDKSASVLRGHTDWVNSVRIDLPSRTIFSASDDLTVRLWDLDTKTTIRIFEGHVGQVQQVVPLPPEFEFSESDDILDGSLSSTHSSPSLAHGVLTPPISVPSASLLDSVTSTDPIPPLTRSPPPRYMLTSALDSTIRLWDVASGRSLRTFFGHVEGVWALAADTLRLVSGSEDRTAKVWDPRSGGCERTFTGHAGPVTCVGLSECRLATGGEDGEVRLYCFGGWLPDEVRGTEESGGR